ncbi:MAG: hypothetical protein KDD82_11535 [Planctomycetes bacterium]|nr:hypothetical protein [Planctomycetota bacterium]
MSAAVWITGVGAATRLGAGVECLDRALRQPRPAGAGGVDAAQAAAALCEAVDMAQLPARLRVNVGLFVGCTWAGLEESELAVASHVRDEDPDDEAWSRHGSDHLLARLVRSSGLGGVSLVVSAAGGGSAEALDLGARWLATSACPAVAVGGVQLATRVGERCFAERVGVDPDGCRPLSPERRGTTLAPGAGFLVLERAEAAARRGARPLAVLQAVHAQAGPNALVRVLEEAQAAAPDLWLCHASGGVKEDAEEAAALRAVLGEPVAGLAASKALLGHTQGAAAALDAVIATLALRGGFFPCLEPGAELQTVSAERLVPRSATLLCRNLLDRAWAVHLGRAPAPDAGAEDDASLAGSAPLPLREPPEPEREPEPRRQPEREPAPERNPRSPGDASDTVDPHGSADDGSSEELPNPFASDYAPVEPPPVDPEEEA